MNVPLNTYTSLVELTKGQQVTVTSKMNGKMKGFNSLNTSPLSNKFCNTMNKGKSICGDCYSCTMSKMYTNMHKRFSMNGYLLSKTLPKLPMIMMRVFRLDAHGELHNVLHLYNLCRLAEENEGTRFTLWTKRIDIVRELFIKWGYKKPSNLHLIWSVSQKNRINVKFPSGTSHLFDKMFIVHDKGTQDKSSINCQQECASCMLCYSDNDVRVINELVH